MPAIPRALFPSCLTTGGFLMKKILFSIVVMFTFAFSCCTSLVSSASVIDTPLNNYVVNDVVSLEGFQKEVDDGSFYIHVAYKVNNWIYTYYIVCNGDSDSNLSSRFTSVEETETTVTVLFNVAHYWQAGCPVGSNNIENYGRNNTLHKLVYYKGTGVIEIYKLSSGTYYKQSVYTGDVVTFSTNIFNYKSGLDIEVTFNPPLNGSLDRIVDQNGVPAESNYFSMKIVNNTRSAVQFMFAIVPKGNPLTFSSKAMFSNGIDMQSAKAVYYFTCNEWVYAPIITSNTDQINSKLEKTYNQSCSWHYIASGSEYNRSFNWSQINIKKDVEYDAVVLAIPTTYDKPSRCFVYKSFEHYLDVADGKEVYRSTFSVANPVPYDSSCSEFDNNPNSGLLNKDVNNASAYVDSETGDVVVKDVSAQEYRDNVNNWEPGLIEKEINGFDFGSLLDGSFSFSNLTGSFQNVFSGASSIFGFFGSFFSFMPSWFWAILLFGIVCLVIIGIIKALR